MINIGLLLEILEHSKDNNVFSNPTQKTIEVVQTIGIGTFDEKGLTLSREERMKLAMFAVSRGLDFENVIAQLTWKDFEGFVTEVMKEHSFKCVESLRRVGNTLIEGMEIDVVGVRSSTIITIDAKMWGIRKGKTTALKNAAEKQMKRADELSRNLSILYRKMPRLASQEYKVYPMLVTWLVEEVLLHEGIPIVPIFKLNSFLLEFERYQDLMKPCDGIFEKIERRED
ncbi:MAG: hypothetical protein GF411_03225 [Candidatus Lokiarchaeota archaeon]|nr:hypothetical protein [Candidatus Lokiarchaeota archaeon]